MLKRFVLVVLSILLVGVLVACGGAAADTPAASTEASSESAAAPEESPEPSDKHVHAPLAAGTATQIDAGGGEIHKLTILEIADPASSGNQFMQPGDGNRFWALKLEIENAGTDALFIGDWKLRGSDDYEYDTTFMSGIDPQLEPLKNLTPGGKTAGWVVFEMPDGVTAKWLRYDPNIISEEDLYFEAQ